MTVMLKLQETTLFYLLILAVIRNVLSTYVYYRQINRYCIPFHDCPPGHEILPCVTDYSQDICAPCYKDRVQPDLISSSPDGDTTATSCFIPTSVCLANDLTYSRHLQKAYCTSLGGCKCNTNKCYYGDPCLCERKYDGCGIDKTLNDSGECVPCQEGTIKDDTGCGPCFHKTRTSNDTKSRTGSLQTSDDEARTNYEILFILMVVLAVLSFLLCCMVVRVCCVQFKRHKKNEVVLNTLDCAEKGKLIKKKEGVENASEEMTVRTNLYPDLTNFQSQRIGQEVQREQGSSSYHSNTLVQHTALSTSPDVLENVILNCRLEAVSKIHRSISNHFDSNSINSSKYEKTENDDDNVKSFPVSSTSSKQNPTMIQGRHFEELANSNMTVSRKSQDVGNPIETERLISMKYSTPSNQENGGSVINSSTNRNSVLLSTDSRLFADGLSEDTLTSISDFASGSYITMGVSENTSDITDHMTSTLEDYPFLMNGRNTAKSMTSLAKEKLKILNRLISSDSGVAV